MSIADVRDAFNNAIQTSVRCVRALMMYCDEHGIAGAGKRDHQLLMVELSDGTKHSMIVSPGMNIHAAAAQLAKKAVSNA